jgi:hypothetical protein
LRLLLPRLLSIRAARRPQAVCRWQLLQCLLMLLQLQHLLLLLLLLLRLRRRRRLLLQRRWRRPGPTQTCCRLRLWPRRRRRWSPCETRPRLRVGLLLRLHLRREHGDGPHLHAGRRTRPGRALPLWLLLLWLLLLLLLLPPPCPPRRSPSHLRLAWR